MSKVEWILYLMNKYNIWIYLLTKNIRKSSRTFCMEENQETLSLSLTLTQKCFCHGDHVKVPLPPCSATSFQNSHKPLTPLLAINHGMPSHNDNLYLICEIQTQITIIAKHYPTHQVLLIGEFNRDILLHWQIHNNNPQ